MERVFIIIAGLKFFFFQYPVIINIFIIIVLFGFFLFLKYIYTKPLEIEDLKLYMDFYLFIFSLCVFFLINLLIFCYRIRNIGNKVNLKDVTSKLFEILYMETFATLFYKIVFFIGVILCFLYFFLLLKKLTFLIYCKINFYIIFFYGINKNLQDTFYNKFKWDFYCYYFSKIKYAPKNFLEKIFGKFTGRPLKIMYFITPYYGLLLLFFAFFFDIFFNNYVLYSYFFILPVSLFYQIAYAISNAFSITTDDEEKIICNYLYDPLIIETKKEECNYYISSREEMFTKEHLEEIKLFINCDFDRNKFFYEYLRIFKKRPSLC